eukprot:SAG31_NODE_4812_length_2942_cov_1.217024_2_plen_75_part_00
MRAIWARVARAVGDTPDGTKDFRKQVKSKDETLAQSIKKAAEVGGNMIKAALGENSTGRMFCDRRTKSRPTCYN